MPLSNRKSKSAFTLVEMIVVISMISLLVALLMPSLRAARKQAARTECLARVRQLGISSVSFAVDNKLMLPAPIFNYPTGNRTPADYHYVGQDALAQLYDVGSPTKFFFPSGTLALKGYINDPRTLFCPTFLRTTAADNNWDKPSSTNTIWRAVTEGNSSLPSANSYTGYAEHFYPYADGGESDVPGNQYVKAGSARLDYVELYWNRRPSWGRRNTTATRGWYSPVFYTCAMTNKGGGGRPDITVRGNSHMDAQGNEIVREGFNAVYYDGSARWTSREEVYRLAGTNFGTADLGTPADWISFHYPLFGSGHRWIRGFANPVTPK